LLGIVPKSFPPNYKEFYESRWFSPAASAHCKEVVVAGETVPFGTDLLFVDEKIAELVVGVEICEDLWVPIPPSCLQAISGAAVVANLSASNELIGKARYRRELVSNQSGRCVLAYAYASCGVYESTTDVVFGGHCLIADNGSILAESKRFRRDGFLTMADIDLRRLVFDRSRSNSFRDSLLNAGLTPTFRRIAFETNTRQQPLRLMRGTNPRPFVPENSAELADRCAEIFNAQVAALAKRLEHIGSAHVNIGISGGLDSTLALLVTCKVFKLLGWATDRIHGYTLPGFGTTSHTKSNAHALMEVLGVKAEEQDIRLLCLEEMYQMGHQPFGIDLAGLRTKASAELSNGDIHAVLTQNNALWLADFENTLLQLTANAQNLVFENVQARMRTSILMNRGFVIGTGDLSELALGWCTYNADHMNMYNPNCSIPKTLVKFLVRWAAMNEFDGATREVLLSIADTVISPELLPPSADGNIQQSTEDILGPYEVHDFIMFHFLRAGKGPLEIMYLFEQTEFVNDYPREKLIGWLRLFFTRFFQQQYKRSCLPDGPKVGSVSLSPRGDWRMPSDASAALWLSEIDKLSNKRESLSRSLPRHDRTLDGGY
jgi:NAD+ synthase (glutamine-hydrolysing)